MKIPMWRGFNLTDFEHALKREPNSSDTTEDDFVWMSDWGFDFVRLPMAYPLWIDYDQSNPIAIDDLCKIEESTLDQIDRIVELGRKYSLHVSLNFHRAPGYCVNPGFTEPFDLWKDKEAQDVFCFYWGLFAERYKNIPPADISFNLLNEPSLWDPGDPNSSRRPVPAQIHRSVMEAATQAIRKHNPDHLVICDGNNVGREVCPELTDLDVVQSCRSYLPVTLSHYDVPWTVSEMDFPEPVWPGVRGDEYWDGGGIWNRDRLERYYKPWIDLANQGIGVHCGECGCYCRTPHKVFLAWFSDVLDILRNNGIGYALWEFRGTFGVLDSERSDVEYEDWYGHKLDRKLLDLLRNGA